METKVRKAVAKKAVAKHEAIPHLTRGLGVVFDVDGGKAMIVNNRTISVALLTFDKECTSSVNVEMSPDMLAKYGAQISKACRNLRRFLLNAKEVSPDGTLIVPKWQYTDYSHKSNDWIEYHSSNPDEKNARKEMILQALNANDLESITKIARGDYLYHIGGAKNEFIETYFQAKPEVDYASYDGPVAVAE